MSVDKNTPDDQTEEPRRRPQRLSEDSDPTHFPGGMDQGGERPPAAARPRTYRPVLICLSGQLRGQRKSLSAPETVIGRSSSADWQLDDSAASRHHVRIDYENWTESHEMPRCFVEDLGSRNGTELNGRVIREREQLRERDRVLVGATLIGFFVRDEDELRHDDSLYISATRDMLTGLDNRRQLREHLRHHLARAERYDMPISFLLLDLDHFKVVNDTYGHDVGDSALCHVAELLRKGCRESDLVARWGGEEFAICLPDTEQEHAEALAERLRESVETNHMVDEGRNIELGISIGGASFRKGDDADSLFQRADQMLYRAKNRGRNRVVFAAETKSL